MKTVSLFFSLILFLFAAGRVETEEKLMVLCGAAFKFPVEEIAQLFQKSNNINIRVSYGAAPTILSQVELTRKGDVLIAPSEDITGIGKKKGLIMGNSVKNIAYLAPCINVQRGNPKNIRALKDLARDGVRIAISNPKFVYIGMLTAEIVDKNLSGKERAAFKKNVVVQAEDFNKTATLLVLKYVDAIIGFHFLESWYPQNIGTVKLNIDEIHRIGSAQAGIISYSQFGNLAQKFLNYLNSSEAKTIFKKYGYFITEQEAFSWIGAKKPIGGDYTIPIDW